MSDRLANKVAIVTGGASGIGLATVIRFIEQGASVVVTDRDQESLDGAFGNIGNVEPLDRRYQDVTEEEGWGTLVSDVLSQYGHLDILVNNAGIVIRGTAEDTTMSDWRKTQQVNLDAVFMGTRAAIGAMKGIGGSIINISSIEGMVGEATAAAYNASKGGVRIFTKSAALHCASQNYRIRVNSIHPGFIRTPMIDNALASMPTEEVEALLSRMANEIPLGSMGEPEDIADGCLYLASDESRYVTGSELVIDGGYTCR